MRAQLLTVVALINTFADCLPQRQTSVITLPGFTIGFPGGDPTFSFPTDFPFPTRTDDGPGFTIVIPDTTTSTRRITSKTTITSRSSSVTPSTSTSSIISTTSSTSTKSSTTKSSTSSTLTTITSTSTIKSTSSSTSVIPPPTTSTSTIKSTTTSKPPPPTTTSTTTTKSTISTTTTPPASASTNPYAASCPIPSNFTISNFVSISGTGGDASLLVTYGSGTFACPNGASAQTVKNGIYDMSCDIDGLVHVTTDGANWVYIQERFYCGSVPGSHILQASTNFTTLNGQLFCDTDDLKIRSCFQLDGAIILPVQVYSSAPANSISFSPLDEGGLPLSQCPTVPNVQPIVTDVATCAPPVTTSSASVSGETTTISHPIQTQTVIINGR